MTDPGKPDSDAATELSARRTGMSFQRTRMSADRTLMSVHPHVAFPDQFGFAIYEFLQKVAATAGTAGRRPV